MSRIIIVEDNSIDGREELSVPGRPALRRPVVSEGCIKCIRVPGGIISLVRDTLTPLSHLKVMCNHYKRSTNTLSTHIR